MVFMQTRPDHPTHVRPACPSRPRQTWKCAMVKKGFLIHLFFITLKMPLFPYGFHANPAWPPDPCPAPLPAPPTAKPGSALWSKNDFCSIDFFIPLKMGLFPYGFDANPAGPPDSRPDRLPDPPTANLEVRYGPKCFFAPSIFLFP